VPAKANTGDDEHDSDGVVPPGGTYPEVSLTTGDAGIDNPSFDFGFVEHTPAVDIEKYDTTGGPVAADADTAADAVAYAPDSSRTIRFDLTNTGTDALQDVTVTDDTITGGTVTAMSCTFPGHAGATAGQQTGDGWSVDWAESHGTPPAETWAPDAVFSCTATLTMAGDAAPHADTATVTGTSVDTGATVTDTDDYHAFTGDVQLVKYDGRDGFVPTADGDGVPQKPLVDGAERDANDAAGAVTYVAAPGTGSTGAQPVSWSVTNTGTTWLGEIEIADDTLDGPALQDVSCDFSPLGGPATGTSWAGPWEPGTTFTCQGELTLDAATDPTHADRATVTSTVIAPEPNPAYVPGDPGSNPFTDQPATDGAGAPILSDVHPADDDDYYADTTLPSVDLIKGDGDAASATIVHDGDTMDGQAYAPDETRSIVMNLENTGQTPLYDVTVTDALTSGDTTVQALSCLFPGETVPTAGTLVGTTWTVYWVASFEGASPTAWQPGVPFSCTATLSLDGSAAPHVDTATVTTNLSPAGVPGDAGNPPPTTPDGPTHQDVYSAYTGDIQVIKYDGSGPAPSIGAGPNAWTAPGKPLADAGQDANTWQNAVDYPVGVPMPVQWVVTNTGATWLTDITLSDTTGEGPDIGAWTCDLSGVGGPGSYSFTSSGPWAGPLAPGASFICAGPLTMPENARHADTVDVAGVVVQPSFDGNGQPILDGDGVPEYATDGSGNPIPGDVTVYDDDEFHATTTSVRIVKGDGHDDTVVNDADTTETGAVYAASGETRTIVSVATNPSQTPLHDVALSDVTTAGPAPLAMSCAFPDGSQAAGSYDAGTATWTIRWEATFAPGTATWMPGDEIVCHSSLTLGAASAPHQDVATVAAVTPAGGDVTDDNPYNAFSGDIQVIKYDGDEADPAVGQAGAWTPPSKLLLDPGQDADDAGHAVHYPLDASGTSTGAQTVRWVVTNTGTTWLTDVVIADVTDLGPSLDAATVRCEFPDGTVGGVVGGAITWSNPSGVLFEPGASFFCEGTLTLQPSGDHADHVDAIATIVPPAPDVDGVPTSAPEIGPDSQPVRATDPSGAPATVDDADAFHAMSAAAIPLAATGVDVAGDIGLMTLLLLGGLLLVALGRRRRED